MARILYRVIEFANVGEYLLSMKFDDGHQRQTVNCSSTIDSITIFANKNDRRVRESASYHPRYTRL